MESCILNDGVFVATTACRAVSERSRGQGLWFRLQTAAATLESVLIHPLHQSSLLPLCLRHILMSSSTTTTTRTGSFSQDTVVRRGGPFVVHRFHIYLPRKAAQQEGGEHEHEQAQPRGAREEDCHQTHERREEQPHQGQSNSFLKVKRSK